MTSPLISAEIQKLSPSAIIELFVLDLTELGGDVYRFHAGTNELRQDVVWQGDTYVRFPIEISGFELNSSGTLPRPRLRASNLLGTVTSLLLAFGDLIGAKVIRRRTLAKYLDAANFDGGLNPTEDTTAEFPDDVYFIDRKVTENRDIVEFELASALDLAGVKLPRRQVIQALCPWKYRGAECGYTGAPLWDANDEVIAGGSSPEALALVAAYQAMLAAKADLDNSVSVLSTAQTSKDAACEPQRLEVRFTGNNYVVLYSGTASGNPIPPLAVWDGSPVTLGSTYRVGALVSQNTGAGTKTHRIERWGVNSATCTPATTTLSTATSDRNTKLSTYNSAVSAYEAAVAALPEGDSLFLIERCGKRLSSCRLRFGATAELPFGGFPGAGTVR